MNEIRFDLEDIVSANLVDDILCSINMMSEKISLKKVKFWYNGKFTDKQIGGFRVLFKKSIKSDIPFNITKKNPQSEFVWFDVISDIKSKGSQCRFSYVYPSNKKSEMLNGIHNYFNIASYIEKANQGARVYYKPKENQK